MSTTPVGISLDQFSQTTQTFLTDAKLDLTNKPSVEREGHTYTLLTDGSYQHDKPATTEAPQGENTQAPAAGTSPWASAGWMAVALFAAATVVGVFAILGYIPTGLTVGAAITGVGGAAFLGSLIYMVTKGCQPSAPKPNEASA